MRNLTLQGIVLVFLIGLLTSGCGEDKSPTASEGFVAELKDFADYKSWEVIDYTVSFHPILGAAHMGNQPEYSRRVYASPASTMREGEYPVQAIFLKETFTWEDGRQKFTEPAGILAMVKRGGDFNPNGGGWEWFDLAPDLSKIAGRGGEEMMGGMCNSCHAQAVAQGGVDQVFPHPREHIAEDADFADYKTWTLTDETSASHSILGAAHQPGSLRRIYKKQILANPETEAQGYPIGTTIVKEVEVKSAIVEITAMVKRGGSFNMEGGGWEWFMLDPSNLTSMGRGADLMNGGCSSCHEAAENTQYGKDYVFKHPNDPFNR